MGQLAYALNHAIDVDGLGLRLRHRNERIGRDYAPNGPKRPKTRHGKIRGDAQYDWRSNGSLGPV